MNSIEKPRPNLPPDAFSLPGHYYTDPRNYHAELERFFLSGWIHVGRADQIPDAGDYVLREVAGESIILVRDESGEIRSFFNVCRHRGTRLCEPSQGNGQFSALIRCPYHAWTYDLSGKLVAAPHMEGAPHFCKEDYSLVGLASGRWDGHIFINLAENPTPLHDHLRDLPEKFRPWNMERLRLTRRVVYDVAANWKLIIQNYSECLHCPGVHPALQRLSHFLSGENEPATPSYLGGWMHLREGIDTLSMDGTACGPPLPGLNGEDRKRVHYYAVIPNLLLSLHPDYVMTHTLWPRAVDRTEIVCEWHFPPETLACPDFSPEPAVVFWDMTNRQDWHVCEQMQLGIGSRAYRPGPYSPREDLLFAFDRIIREPDLPGQASGPGS